MRWKRPRWCLFAMIACSLAAPAEGYSAEPPATPKGAASEQPASAVEAPATDPSAHAAEPHGAKAPKADAAPLGREQDAGMIVAPAADAPTMSKRHSPLVGLVLSVGGTSASTFAFFQAFDLRNRAEALNNELTRGGRAHSCTESLEAYGACMNIDRFDAAADFAIVIGITAAVGACIGVVMTIQPTLPASSSAKSPGPSVALAPVPGGGMLRVMGAF